MKRQVAEVGAGASGCCGCGWLAGGGGAAAPSGAGGYSAPVRRTWLSAPRQPERRARASSTVGGSGLESLQAAPGREGERNAGGWPETRSNAPSPATREGGPCAVPCQAPEASSATEGLSRGAAGWRVGFETGVPRCSGRRPAGPGRSGRSVAEASPAFTFPRGAAPAAGAAGWRGWCLERRERPGQAPWGGDGVGARPGV